MQRQCTRIIRWSLATLTCWRIIAVTKTVIIEHENSHFSTPDFSKQGRSLPATSCSKRVPSASKRAESTIWINSALEEKVNRYQIYRNRQSINEVCTAGEGSLSWNESRHFDCMVGTSGSRRQCPWASLRKCPCPMCHSSSPFWCYNNSFITNLSRPGAPGQATKPIRS